MNTSFCGILDHREIVPGCLAHNVSYKVRSAPSDGLHISINDAKMAQGSLLLYICPILQYVLLSSMLELQHTKQAIITPSLIAIHRSSLSHLFPKIIRIIMPCIFASISIS